MADLPAEEIEQLEQIVATLRRRMGALELQRARLGEHTPPHIILEIEDIKRELAQRWANLRRLRPGPTAESAPYLGLLTFHEQDAERFFGRGALVADLVERAGHTPFLVVLGPSGSGKSSVVRAGLVPMLQSGALPGSEHWRYLTFKPGARPLDVLALELTKLQGGDVSSVLLLSRQLAETDRALLLAAGLLLDRAAGQRLVLVVDQAEELWTLAPAEPEARAAFVNEQQCPFIDQLLAAAAAPATPLLIILTMRADFLHRAAEHPALARMIADHDVIVSPMAPAELREAIERPAELAGAGFEPGLVDELIAQTTGREGALPLLEYTLLELWKADHAGGMLTWQTYHALGGVEGALAQTADTILSRRYTDEQRDELRAILLRLVQPGEGAADTRRRAALADLASAEGSAEAVQALLAPLVEARLLVITTTDHRPPTTEGQSAAQEQVVGGQSSVVEVAHEALIRSWPALRGWVNAARADLSFQIQFEEDAQEWQRSRKSEDFLWGGLRLANAEAWIARAKPRLNARDQAFLDACRAQEQAHIAEKAAAARRLRRLAIALAAAAALALVLAIAAGVFGVQSQRSAATAVASGATAVAEGQRADAQRATAVAAADLALERQLVTQAVADTDEQPDRALLFSMEANQLTGEASARGNLLYELLATIRFKGFLRGQTSWVFSVAFSPDGRTLASASEDNTIRLWDVRTRQPIGGPLEGSSGHVTSVAFSPDGRTLASSSDDGSVRLWDAQTRQPIGDPLIGHTNRVNSVAFSPDGQTLASGSYDESIRLWDVQTRQPIGDPLKGHSDGVNSVAFSPDGRTLASAGDDKTIRLWDARTRQPIGGPLEGHIDPVESVVFSPDGRTLASGSNDGTIRLWDARTRQPIGGPLEGHYEMVLSVAFSPDGQTLASAGYDDTVRLWDVRTRQPIGDPLIGHTNVVSSVAFSPDGRTLAMGGDNTILWNVQTHQPIGDPLQDEDHPSVVKSVAFSPDGRTLASGSEDNTIRLWNVQTRQPIGDPLRGHSNWVFSVAFSPDGQTLASAGDNTIRLWDVRTSQPIGDPLRGPTSGVNSVAFSPDGRTLASGGQDGSVWLWDVRTRQSIGGPLTGHIDAVWSVAFSPDGQTLASGSDDNTIRLWDVRTSQPIGDPLTGPSGHVTSVAFSPDGQTLASGSVDGSVWLWDVGVKSWMSRACGVAGRNLTKQEWDDFIGAERPYHRTCPAFPAGEGEPADAP